MREGREPIVQSRIPFEVGRVNGERKGEIALLLREANVQDCPSSALRTSVRRVEASSEENPRNVECLKP
ncbi:unnamed protein product [Lampetra planeri]